MAVVNAHARRLSQSQRRLLEERLLDFDASWHPAGLEQAVRDLAAAGSPLRLAGLVELVKIDLERHWQQGHRATVESYLQRFPELGSPRTVPADLIQAEYEVRSQFGAAGSFADFAGRFPGRADELCRLIGRASAAVDDELLAACQSTIGLPAATHSIAPAAAPVALPQQFGRYRILKKLGEGGMGAVYLAHDQQIDRRVALKVPRFSHNEGPETLERFYREARSAGTLRHPNLCEVYDVGQIGGIHYLTMPYIEGPPLSKVIEGARLRPLPERQVALLARKVAIALAEAHKKGIVHRDLKPGNILLDQRREPIVTDFGLARRASEEVRLTQNGTVMGTPAYMSPEQVLGEVQKIGPGCDVYSLGVILYELLTGRLPFEGPASAVLGDIVHSEPPAPTDHRPGLDQRLVAICRKAMAKRVEDRYATMEALANALGEFLQEEKQNARVLRPIPVGQGTGQQRAGGGEPLDLDQAAQRIAELAGREKSAGARAGRGGQSPGGARSWQRGRRARRRQRTTAFWAAAGVVLLAAIVIFVRTDQGVLKIESADPHMRVAVLQGGEEIEILDLQTGSELRLRSGTYSVALKGDRNDLKLSHDEVTLHRGGKVIVRVERQTVARPVPASPEPTPERDEPDAPGRPEPEKRALTAAVRTFELHDDFVLSVAVSPDGKYVLSGDNRGQIHLWELETGKLVKSLEGHTGAVHQVAFFDNGRKAISASGGAYLDSMNGFGSGSDWSVRVWEIPAGQQLAHFAHPNVVLSAAVSPDQRRAASVCKDFTVRLWDLGTQQEVERFAAEARQSQAAAKPALPPGLGVFPPPSAKELFVAAFDPVGEHLVAAGAQTWTWKLGTDDPGREIPLNPPEYIRCLAFMRDGKRILIGGKGGFIRLVEVASGKTLWKVPAHRDRPVGKALTPEITGLAFTPGEKCFLSSGYDGHAVLWDFETRQQIGRFSGHADAVSSVAITPDGRYAVTGSFDKTARVWQLSAQAAAPLAMDPPASSAGERGSAPGAPGRLPSLTNSIGMKLVLIDPRRMPDGGRFLMGSPPGEPGRDELPRDYYYTHSDAGRSVPLPEGDQERQHPVRLTRPYYMGVTEVTQAHWEKVMGADTSGIRPGDTPETPVGAIGYRVESFLRKLSELPTEKAAGRVYRLPSEAEWEYACRAGSTTAYPFGDDPAALGDYAWYVANSGGKPQPVAQKKPNAWGLFDMLGNRREWCRDSYGLYPAEERVDPVEESESPKVVRGGSYLTRASDCRSAWRFRSGLRTLYSEGFGIRVVMEAPPAAGGGSPPAAPVARKPSQFMLASASLKHDNVVESLAFSPDGRWLASGGNDNAVRLWDTTTGESAHVFLFGTNVQHLAFSPDSQLVVASGVVGREGHGRVRAWGVDGVERTEGVIPPGTHGPVVFHPDGRSFLASNANRELVRVSMDPGRPPQVIGDAPMPIVAIDVSADGRLCLTGHAKMLLRLWDLERKEMVREWQYDYEEGWFFKDIFQVHFAPDGQSFWSTETATAFQMDLTDFTRRWSKRTQVWSNFRMAVSPDGTCLATAGRKGDPNHVVLTNAADGSPIGQIQEGLAGCNAVAFHPHFRILASAGPDERVRLWNAETWAAWDPQKDTLRHWNPAVIPTPAPEPVTVEEPEQNSPMLPQAPAKSPLRFLGYVVHDSSQAIPEIAGYTNVVLDARWLKAGEANLIAARQAGIPVVLTFFTDDRPGVEEQLYPVVERHRDVVAGVCWETPYYDGSTPADLTEFGRALKQKFPGLSFWVSFVEKPRGRHQTLPVPAEVDVIVVNNYFDATARAIRAKTDDCLPNWLNKANNRPVLLRWMAWDRAPPGLVRRCEPGALEACFEAAKKHGLSGVLFDHYGQRREGMFDGLDTRPDLVKEIHDAARSLGFDKGESIDEVLQPLFNGKDLSGWTVMQTSGPDDDVHQPAAGGWKVENGALVCTSRDNGWLKSEKQYGDFELALEFKVPPGGNSGVYIRSPASGHLSRTGIEVQVLDDSGPRFRNLPREKRTAALFGVCGPSPLMTAPAGQWNAMVIRCQGDGIQVTLNGTRVIDADAARYPVLRDRPRSGFIGLSNWHGEAQGVAFRNIRLRKL